MTDTKTFTSPKTKAFIYLRKSQDREDRQVLSIEGQLKIARKLVEQHCLDRKSVVSPKLLAQGGTISLQKR
jgi:hypothetical protein